MSTSAHPSAPGSLLPVRVCAVAGLLLSGFLAYQKFTGAISYLQGCGQAGACEEVMGSRWSQWFYIPVPVFSFLLYAGVLIFSRLPRGLLLTASAVALFGGFLWFGGLQLFVLHRFCPWCLAAHLIGLACGALILTLPAEKPVSFGKPVTAGLASLLILAVGQIFGPAPQTYAETRVSTSPAVPAVAPQVRTVTLGGRTFTPSALPHVGDPEAPHVIAVCFDYACDACRDAEGDVAAAVKRYPGQLCVLLLPCPIDRSANPYIPPRIREHPGAAELARLGMACWRADPESFPAVHEALFSRPVLTLAAAQERVKPLLSKPLAADALKDPWIDGLLHDDFEHYKTLVESAPGKEGPMMPKLLFTPELVIHGVMDSREAFFARLEKELGLKAP